MGQHDEVEILSLTTSYFHNVVLILLPSLVLHRYPISWKSQLFLARIGCLAAQRTVTTWRLRDLPYLCPRTFCRPSSLPPPVLLMTWVTAVIWNPAVKAHSRPP